MYNNFMKKSIIFVNKHGFGDILHSRQGVRWVVDQLGDQFDYYFIHSFKPNTCFIHEKVKIITSNNILSQSMNYVKKILSPILPNHLKDALWIDVWAASFEK